LRNFLRRFDFGQDPDLPWVGRCIIGERRCGGGQYRVQPRDDIARAVDGMPLQVDAAVFDACRSGEHRFSSAVQGFSPVGNKYAARMIAAAQEGVAG
jgi:hypothetical protein